MTTPAEPADAQLVALALTGDRAAFAAIYDRYADRLHDFCVSILRDRDDAADAVQDTFLLAAERLVQLRDPQRLRPWLYAVARSVALRRVRDRKRYAPDFDLAAQADTGALPQQAAEQAALRELVWSAAAGLSDRDRALLDLHLRHGLEGAELGEAMGISTGHAYVLLTRLRGQLERSLGALLIARLGRRDCAELAELLKSWDGSFSPLMRKRIARHVDRCRTCGERRRRAVSPVALLTAVPLIPAPVYLRELVLDRVNLVAHHGPAEPPESGPAEPPESGPAEPPESGPAEPPGSRPAKPPSSRRRRLVGAGAVLVVLAGTGAGLWAGTRTAPELTGGVGAGPSSTPGAQSPAVVVPESSPAPAVPPVPPPSEPQPAISPPSEPEPVIPPPSGLPLPPRPEAPAPQTTIRPVPSPPEPVDTSGPVIVRLDTSPTWVGLPGCAQDRVAVRAEVTDDSGVESVILNWTDPDGRIGIIELIPTATSWRGTLGPFTRPGRVRWRLVATDTVGNTTMGSPANLPVISCATPTPTPVPEENS